MVKENSYDYIVFTIIRIVSENTGVTYEQMKTKSRKRESTESRQICMFLIHKYTKLPLRMIGLKFGGRDNSTVIHACQKVDDLMIEARFKHQLETIISRIEPEIDFKLTPSKIKFEMKRINLIRKYNSLPSYELASMILSNSIY
jgi:hypothetical protein